MHRMPMRLGLIAAALASLVLTLGFVEQVPWAIDLWPWETSRLSFIFIASILAAIAMPVLWIGVSGELAAMRAGAIDLAITYGGAFLYLVTLLGDDGQPELWPYVLVFGLGFVGMIATFTRTRRTGWRDRRPMPSGVRLSFAAFAVMLIVPWALDDETSVMFGLIYLCAAAYFLVWVVEPRWPNAAGQLIGFLAYYLVLIGPFVDRFGEVSGGELTSLIVYTAFVVYSGALAAYYLFVAPATRLNVS